MTEIKVDLTQIDKDAGQHWLAPPKQPFAIVPNPKLDEIRRKNREKYLRKLKQSRDD